MADDLTRLLVDLAQAGPKAQAVSYVALRVEAHKMRDEWREAVNGTAFRGAAAALDYDIFPAGLRGIVAEVGYRKTDAGSRLAQGNIGNILEFGTSTQGPIRPAGAKVLKGGADRLEKYLAGLDPL